MRSRIPAALALALAAPAAIAGEESPADPPLQDARSNYAEGVSSREVRVPIRSQYFRTPGGHTLGDFTASFFASELVTFDDNVLLDDSDPTSDLVFSTTLGTRLTSEGSRTEVDFAAALTQETYVRDSGDQSWGGWIQGIARFGAERGFYVLATERALARDTTVTQSLAAPGDPIVATSTTVERSYQNNAGVTVGTREDKYSVDLRYDYSFRNYGGALDPQGSVENRVTLLGRRIHSPKSELGLELEARTVRFEEPVNNDYDTIAAFASALWIPTPKTTIEGRGGHLRQSTSASGTVTDTSEFAGFNGSISLLHEVSPKLFVDAVASRDIFPALGSNYQLVNLVGTTARWEFRQAWLARAGLTLQESRYSNGPDGWFGTIDLSVSWSVSDRFQASLSWQHQRFDGEAANTDYTKNQLALQLSVDF